MKRDDFLGKIKKKIEGAYLPMAEVSHPGSFVGYSWDAQAAEAALVTQFRVELEALSGHVYVLDDVEETADVILEILEKHQTKRLIAWGDNALGLDNLQVALEEAGIVIGPSDLPDDTVGRKERLGEIDDVFVGLTGAHGGLADTGAVGLLSGAERGRLASLAPPVHIALLRRGDIYPSLPAFLAEHGRKVVESSNLVFIAGPSRTGDIEMTLSIGVHGPGEVHVIVVP